MKISDYNRLKRCLVFFLAVLLAIPVLSMPTAVYAASFSDLNGHWADQYIKNAVSKGFVAGYPDRTFCPDKSVTRAEFVSMINKALGNTGTTSISFSDVPSSEWYYKEVAKGISASFAGGYDDNTFRPNNFVSRQEAAVMLSRIIPTYGTSTNLKTYSDSSSISDWATSAMSKVCGKGYIGAYKDGQLHPLDNITRAQTAKILCDILDSETIVSGTTTVKSDGTTLSNRIYSNDVVLHADLGSGEATLSNCIVLGTLYVYGGGENTVNVKNSRVANAVVEKTSSRVRLLAQGESVIANATAAKTSILETSGLTGGLYGTGFNLVNVKGSANATLKGSFVRVNVVGSSAKVDLESGTISTLNVESAGANSDITVASSATVSTTNVNGKAAFHGSGTINTMNANTSGITYETKPKNVKASNSSNNPNVGTGTTGSSTIGNITISPKNGATDVDVNGKITLTFNSATTKYNGTALTSSTIDDVIELHEKNTSGSKVNFSASINSAKTIITITPDEDLDEDTKYYVTIDKNALKVGNDGNPDFSTYFTTDDTSGGSSTFDGITISPKNGATNIDVDTKITLTFDSAVTEYDGDSLTSSNIDDVIELHEKSSSGTEVDFDASINSSKKVITITPEDDLDEDTKYYVTIGKNKLKFDSKGNSSFSSYFTTDDDSNGSSTINGITISPKRGATNVDLDNDITLTFDKAITEYDGDKISDSRLDNLIELHKSKESGSEIDFDATINTAKKVITINPKDNLSEDTKYYVTIDKNTFKNSDGGNAEFSCYFTTGDASNSSVTFYPKNNDTGVSTSVDPQISFSSKIETYTGKTIKDSYLDSSVINFREGNKNGSRVSFKASINTSEKTITIDPNSSLKAGQQYYLEVVTKKLRTQSGEKNISSTSVIWTTTGNVDTSSIDTDINNANAAKSAIKVSIDGTDVGTNVYWVTQEQLNLLTSAITTASNAKSTVTTVAQAQSAAAALKVSTDTFNSNKKKGTKPQISTTSLRNTITDAGLAKENIIVSTDGFDVSPSQRWVTKATLDTLNSAISTAESALGAIETSSQLMSSIDTLNSAVNTFKSQINAGKKSDKTDLLSAISTANTTIGQVRMQNSADGLSAGTKWVTSAEYKVLADLIEAAIAMNSKRDATQAEIDAATSALNTAKENFPIKTVS